MKWVYKPQVFNVTNIEEAKRIILVEDKVFSTQQRWENETPYEAEQLQNLLQLDQKKLILDYGCGLGRVAKEIIARSQCSVIGADISASMRLLSIQYVSNNLFTPCAPQLLKRLQQEGLQVDAAYCIWVLQHCENPEEDIALIHSLLKKNGLLYVMNAKKRALPIDTNEFGENKIVMVDDQINILDLLTEKFDEIASFPIPNNIMDPAKADHYFIKLWRKGKQMNLDDANIPI